MSEARRALVLHSAGGGAPIIIAVGEQVAEELAPRLRPLLAAGTTVTVTAENGSLVAVNYAHIATAHIEPLDPLARVFGSQKR